MKPQPVKRLNVESPSYYAIIPSDVRYDSNLSSSEKLLYAELTALCSKQGYCWASNNYFSGLYGVNKNTISSWVSSLVKSGYIKIDVDRSKGNLRKVYLKKSIAIPKKIKMIVSIPYQVSFLVYYYQNLINNLDNVVL